MMTETVFMALRPAMPANGGARRLRARDGFEGLRTTSSDNEAGSPGGLLQWKRTA